MPIKYIPYTPNTVEGQAVLDNFSRTRRVLRYRDNDKVYDRIKRGMPYYEVEPIEQVGDNSENLVIRGECISACAYLKEQGIKVELKDLKNLLHAVVVEDIVEFATTEKEGVYTTEINKFVSDRLMQKIKEFNEKGNLQSIVKGKKFDPIIISKNGLELIELVSLDCTNATGKWQSDSEIKIDKLGYISINSEKTKEFWNGKIGSDKKPFRLKTRNISGDETIVKVG